MVKIVGVRFRNAGKVYFFDPQDYEVKTGDHVIVETARGLEYGTVAGKPQELEESKVVQPLKPVIRIASEEDEALVQENREKELEAIRVCRERIRRHELDMKLIDAEYTFDGNKIMFYFTADGRVDFRDLVKDLASYFRTRIELRQIGVRDETKIIGGVGICGRELCCHAYLQEFAPVSIKMAKEQNLSLNPTKISGVCGRLMCCLKNEEDTYEYLNSKLPGIGDTVITASGLRGEVSSVNVLRQRVKVLVELDDEKELQEYDVKDLKFRPRSKKRDKNVSSGREEKPQETPERMEENTDVEIQEVKERPSRTQSLEGAETKSRVQNPESGEGRNRQTTAENKEGKSRSGAQEKEGRPRGGNQENREGRNRTGNPEGKEGKSRAEGQKNKEGKNRVGGQENKGSHPREEFRGKKEGRNRTEGSGKKEGQERKKGQPRENAERSEEQSRRESEERKETRSRAERPQKKESGRADRPPRSEEPLREEPQGKKENLSREEKEQRGKDPSRKENPQPKENRPGKEARERKEEQPRGEKRERANEQLRRDSADRKDAKFSGEGRESKEGSAPSAQS